MTYNERTLFVSDVRVYVIRVENTIFTYTKEHNGTLEYVHDYGSLFARLISR